MSFRILTKQTTPAPESLYTCALQRCYLFCCWSGSAMQNSAFLTGYKFLFLLFSAAKELQDSCLFCPTSVGTGATPWCCNSGTWRNRTLFLNVVKQFIILTRRIVYFLFRFARSFKHVTRIQLMHMFFNMMNTTLSPSVEHHISPSTGTAQCEQ